MHPDCNGKSLSSDGSVTLARATLAPRANKWPTVAMARADITMDLCGKLLVAMPGMGDSRFEKAVIFMCAHTPEGAMGLIVNKPARHVNVTELLRQLKIETTDNRRNIPAYFGGPVEHGRGFVLHSADYQSGESTLKVDEQFGMTATLDILEEIANGNGPETAILMLGYSGWGPGQVEDEIVQNGWLTCDATPEIVFAEDNEAKWTAALKTLGIDPQSLSATAGRA
jgi:putative transcriptional regulator